MKNNATKTTKTYSSVGTYTPTGLAANTTYYVRVRAKSDRMSYSEWSSVKSATTKSVATQLATPSLSVSAASSSSLSVTIGAVANATGYTLEYSTSSNFMTKTPLISRFAYFACARKRESVVGKQRYDVARAAKIKRSPTTVLKIYRGAEFQA